MPTPTTGEVIALGVLMPILDVAAVSIRIYVKRAIRRLGLDDVLILLATFMLVGCSAVCITGAVAYGYGKVSNGGNAEADDLLINTKRLTNAVNWTVPLLFGSSKLSVLFFYRSIFRGNVFNVVVWTMIAMTLIWSVGSFFAVIMQCGTHTSLLWGSGALIQKYCLPGFTIAISISATDVFTDLLILTIPVYWTMQLHMTLTKKLAVCGVFLFGSLAVLASIGRLIAFAYIYPGHNGASNQLGYLTAVAYYAVLEAGIVIIACCLPTFGPLFNKKRAPNYRSSNLSSVGGLRGSRSRSSKFFPRTLISLGHNTSTSQTKKFRKQKDNNFIKLENIVHSDGVDRRSDSNVDHQEGRITVTTNIQTTQIAAEPTGLAV